MNYPTTLPLADIQEIIRIIQTGSMVPEKAHLAKHLWIVQGYGQYSLFGDPDVPTLTGMEADLAIQSLAIRAQAAETMPELVDALKAIVAQNAPGNELRAQSLAVPITWLLQLVMSKLVELLVEYLKNKI